MMKTTQKFIHVLVHSFLTLGIFNVSIAYFNETDYCNASTSSLKHYHSSNLSLLSHMTLCRSQKLYLRTSIGLFHVSSVDYNTKLLTITTSQSPCTSSVHEYISPMSIKAGLPSPPLQELTSLLLFNCIKKDSMSLSIQNNCTRFHTCGPAAEACSLSSKIQKQEKVSRHPCLQLDDVENLSKIGFRPKALHCSHYCWAHKTTSTSGEEGYELGTRISFDLVPEHLPDLCKECKKPNGNCGVGLRCICRPKDCKDRVISKGNSLKATTGHVSFLLLSFLSLMVILLMNSMYCVTSIFNILIS